MFWMDKSKVQADEIPAPEGLPPDVIISPDTRRAGRIPPGQSRTTKRPVLDASGQPAIDLECWRLDVSGLGGRASARVVGPGIRVELGRFSQAAQGEGLRRLSLRHALVAAGQCLGRRLHARVTAAGRRRAA